MTTKRLSASQYTYVLHRRPQEVCTAVEGWGEKHAQRDEGTEWVVGHSTESVDSWAVAPSTESMDSWAAAPSLYLEFLISIS